MNRKKRQSASLEQSAASGVEAYENALKRVASLESGERVDFLMPSTATGSVVSSTEARDAPVADATRPVDIRPRDAEKQPSEMPRVYRSDDGKSHTPTAAVLMAIGGAIAVSAVVSWNLFSMARDDIKEIRSHLNEVDRQVRSGGALNAPGAADSRKSVIGDPLASPNGTGSR